MANNLRIAFYAIVALAVWLLLVPVALVFAGLVWLVQYPMDRLTAALN